MAELIASAGCLVILYRAGSSPELTAMPELAIVSGRTNRPWGIGFLSWSATVDVVKMALEYQPTAVMSSFGDPSALTRPVLEAGVHLILQVTEVDEARHALDIGADVIVAQGAEAGGHGGRRATLPFVPTVVDLAGATPVLARGRRRGQAQFQAAAANGDLSVVPVWVSEAIDLITSLSPAAELVTQLVTEAETALTLAGKAITTSR